MGEKTKQNNRCQKICIPTYLHLKTFCSDLCPAFCLLTHFWPFCLPPRPTDLCSRDSSSSVRGAGESKYHYLPPTFSSCPHCHGKQQHSMKNKVKPRPTYPTIHLEESFFEKSSGLDLPFCREQKPSSTQQSRFLTELLEYPGTKTCSQNTEPKTPLSIHWEVPCRLLVLPAWSVPNSFCFSPQCGSPGLRHIPALLCWAPPTSLHGNRWLFSMFQKLYNLSCTNYNIFMKTKQISYPFYYTTENHVCMSWITHR